MERRLHHFSFNGCDKSNEVFRKGNGVTVIKIFVLLNNIPGGVSRQYLRASVMAHTNSYALANRPIRAQ